MQEEDSIHIKDYQIHQPPLGEGSFGRVFRATYRGISERAVKVFDNSAVDLSTMARELEKLSSVAEHHGIVTLHDFDLLCDTPYYAMGLHATAQPDGTWETRTLEPLCGKLEPREAWRLLREVADAVAYLHRNHIIHCDLKPSNILLTDENPIGTKICDFGQSRGDALEAFDPAGTPLYASPEQLRNPRDSAGGKGFRWDVYSFGVVAYKLITGRLPRLRLLASTERTHLDPEASIVDEGSLDSTLGESRAMDGERLARMTESEVEIEWPEDLSLPQEWRDLVEKCLAIKAGNRFADMREVRNAMTAIEQRRVVNRARRLNTIFASLLVIAIWASGWALLQTHRAKQATAEALESRQQAEEFGFFVMNRLDREALSGPALEELVTHIADNADAYLARVSTSRKSTTLFRMSATRASLRGWEARKRGDLEEALKQFANARDIRLELAEANPGMKELTALASSDMMEIGSILEVQGMLEEALDNFTRVYNMRSKDFDLEHPLTLKDLDKVTEPLLASARVNAANDAIDQAIANYESALELYRISTIGQPPANQPAVAAQMIPILKSLAQTYADSGETEKAGETWTEVLTMAANLGDSDNESLRDRAGIAYADALNALASLQQNAGNLTAALDYYRDEVRYRLEASDRRPYDPDRRIQLADAYASVASAIDSEDDQKRSLAISNLQQALRILTSLPREVRGQESVEAAYLSYNTMIASLLEMEE